MTSRVLPILVLSLALTACVREGRQRTVSVPRTIPAGEGCRPYCAGPEDECRQIDKWVEELGTARGEALLEVGRRLLSRGEAAVPALVAALSSDDAQRRGQAAYLLGFAKDRRTVEPLVKATSDPVPAVRYEAAGALLEMRDPRGLPVLIDGLEDPDARLRAKCLAVLAERTGQRFGFEADGSVEDRAAAVRRWRAWLAQKRATGG